MPPKRLIIKCRLPAKRVCSKDHVCTSWYWDHIPWPAQDIIYSYLAHHTLYYRLVSISFYKEISNRITHAHFNIPSHVRTPYIFPNIKCVHITTDILDVCDLRAFQKINTVCIHDISPPYILRIFRNAKQITRIKWVGSKYGNNCLRMLYRWMSKADCSVKSLEIRNKESYCELCHIYYDKMISLEEVSIKHSRDFSLHVIKKICSLPKLRKLTIDNITFISSRPTWNQLISVISTSESVEEFWLSDNLCAGNIQSADVPVDARIHIIPRVSVSKSVVFPEPGNIIIEDPE